MESSSEQLPAPSDHPGRRKWRGVEPEARTAERRERLIGVAIDLLSTEGLAGTTVRAVCARAGLHSRYFYESFADIDALLVAVFDQLAGKFLSEVTTATEAAGQDPRARLQAAVETAAAIVKSETPVVRILTVEAIGNEQLNRRRTAMLHGIAAMMEADAYRIYGDPAPGERMGTLSARFLAAGFAEVLVAWVQGELAGTVEELAGDAMELMLAVSERARTVALERAGRQSKRGC
jgi:AcrR family transcriptional regulator